MKRFIAKTSLWTYRNIFKRILFLFPADWVHSSIVRLGVIAQYLPGILPLMRWMFAYRDRRLQTDLAGLKLLNPVGLSAGFDKEVALPKLMRAVGFGLAEVGSITAKQYSGNPRPWYLRLPKTKSLVVNSGLRSSGVQKIADKVDHKKLHKLQDFVINTSVAKTNHSGQESLQEGVQDYLTTLQRLEKSDWPSFYTINISCPNTMAGEPFNQPKNLQKLLKGIDDLNLKRPVFLKLPIDLSWPKTKQLIDVAAKSSVVGLTIGNLAKDRKLIHPEDHLDLKQRGNLSGKPCFQASNQLIQKTRQTYKDRFLIIGVGGIFTAEDAYRKIRLGANAVEMITGLVYQGPAVVGEINRGLADLLEKDGFKSISEAVGVDA